MFTREPHADPPSWRSERTRAKAARERLEDPREWFPDDEIPRCRCCGADIEGCRAGSTYLCGPCWDQRYEQG